MGDYRIGQVQYYDIFVERKHCKSQIWKGQKQLCFLWIIPLMKWWSRMREKLMQMRFSGNVNFWLWSNPQPLRMCNSFPIMWTYDKLYQPGTVSPLETVCCGIKQWEMQVVYQVGMESSMCILYHSIAYHHMIQATRSSL